MRYLFTLFLLLAFSSPGLAVNITQMEYFFDQDPGVGGGKPVSFTQGSSVNFTLQASLTGLTPGIHHLYLRAKDADGDWGISRVRAFQVIPSADIQVSPITRMEYFVDTDPGLGNGRAVSITSGTGVSLTFQSSLTGLTEGIHHLYVRAMDSDGEWGIARARAFQVISTASLAIPSITRIEYFIDTDPGYGQAPQMTSAVGPNVQGKVLISMSGRPLGNHTLYARARDANGLWSAVKSVPFQISNTVTLVDTDTDGIDDQWEHFHFGNLTTATATSDYDGDGYSDKQEYQHWAAGEEDPAGVIFDPKEDNTPGADPPSKSSFWILMMPVIQSAAQQ